MPRNRKEIPQGYYEPFPSTLRGLLSQKNMSQQEIANRLGISRQTVSAYCDGTAYPSVKLLIKMSNSLETSSDYLLGISNVPSRNEDIQIASKTTGLSGKAIETLQAVKDNSAPEIINGLLESKEFIRIICRKD